MPQSLMLLIHVETEGARNFRATAASSKGTGCAPGERASLLLGVDSFDSGRNDANVSPELEDQVVDIRRSHGTQGG